MTNTAQATHALRFALFSSDGYIGTVGATPSGTGIGAYMAGVGVGHTPNLTHVFHALPFKWRKALTRGPRGFWCQELRNGPDGATTRLSVATSDCAPACHFDAQTLDLHGVRGQRLTRLTAVPYLAKL